VVSHGGVAADLRPEGSDRGFTSRFARQSWPAAFYDLGWHTASFSSFPLRHSAPWWNSGFMQAMNLMRNSGGEMAHEVTPGALEWLRRWGERDNWFLHVHYWDPHTPYNTPLEYGNPFVGDPIPGWITDEVIARHRSLPGPHTAQEPWGFTPDEHGPPPARHPWDISTIDDVRRTFDGYDVGIRYADDAVGELLNQLADLGVLDETAVLVSSDHGEAFGELGVYADHQAADQATCRLPAVLRWPGETPAGTVDDGLHYHLDVGATVVELAGGPVPDDWDGVSFAEGLAQGRAPARDHLVLSQGAWACQRSVRWGDRLYLRTFHDGYHAWNDEMLFDVVADPHEQHDLAPTEGAAVADGAAVLDQWTAESLETSYSPVDPMQVVLDEGGPFHTRARLPEYLDRLRATGRAECADLLADRHRIEL
jgi:arylsulfatase A-like enzyme